MMSIEKRAGPTVHGLYNDPVALYARPLAWIGYILGVLLYAAVSYSWQVEPLPALVYIAGVALAALCLVPITLWVVQGSSGLPIFELICLAYIPAYSVPVYLLPNQILIHSRNIPLEWDVTLRALTLAILGVSCMIVGYYGGRRGGIGRALRRIDLPLSSSGKRVYPAVAICIGLVVMLIQASGVLPGGGGGLDAFWRLAAGQYYIGLALLAYRVFGRNKEPGAARLTLYIAVALGFLLGLSGGMLENALMPPLLVTIIRWQSTHRPPLLWFACGALLVVALTGVKAQYRQIAWSGEESLGVTDRLSLWLDLSRQQVQDSGQDEGGSKGESSLTKTVSRLDLLHILAHVAERTPESIPYYGGMSYAYAVTGWIPRFVWPDKPTAQVENNALVLDYDLLDKADSTTSIGVGHVAEAYANFGVPGVVGVMGLLGMMFGLLCRMLNGPNSEGGRVIYLTALLPFLNGIGAAAAPQLTGAIMGVAASALIIRLAAAERRKAPRTTRDPGTPAHRRVWQ